MNYAKRTKEEEKEKRKEGECMLPSPFSQNHHHRCRNLNLGFATKAKACEGVSQKLSLGVTFYVPGSLGECEGMEPHIPKWALTLGIEVLMDFEIFREWS